MNAFNISDTRKFVIVEDHPAQGEIHGLSNAHRAHLGAVRKRKKKASRPLRVAYGHTPLSILERIPWNCHRLVVGTGVHGALPIVPELSREATSIP